MSNPMTTLVQLKELLARADSTVQLANNALAVSGHQLDLADRMVKLSFLVRGQPSGSRPWLDFDDAVRDYATARLVRGG